VADCDANHILVVDTRRLLTRVAVIKFKFKFIKATQGSKSLLQDAKTYNRHETNKHVYTVHKI